MKKLEEKLKLKNFKKVYFIQKKENQNFPSFDSIVTSLKKVESRQFITNIELSWFETNV